LKLPGLILIFLFHFFFAIPGEAQKPFVPQNQSNLRIKKIAVSDGIVVLDTVSIVPGTFYINGIDSSAYEIDIIKATFTWREKPPADSVSLTYRVFPYRLNAFVQRLNYDSILKYSYIRPFEFDKNDRSERLINFGNLEYNGSFGRGIAFGNNQDAVVTSNFQLQLNGMLGDSIEIAAAITDNNIPIQPDGTTQQLNEFDQIFLQFKKKNWQLNLGDIDLRQNGLYFLNFYKRLEGISFQTTNRLSPALQSSTLVSGSIAKGKFNRNVFQGLEGNQGPYRLSGSNDEFFFIVLAGTERVFLDGELLQRGEDQDYIINYNTAEIAFTPRRMITKDSRIQVEFEYADRNYLNSNLYAYQTVDISNKIKIKVGAFQNNDAKNSQINQTIDSKQKAFLFNIGDSISKAFYPTAGIDSFSTDRILYEKIYYNNGSITDSFYRYSTDSITARYSLSFSEVGKGNGNYEPDLNGANGKVYRFIEPVAGIKQGSFEPVMRLVTPKRQQLISFGTDYQIDKRNVLKTELAISNYDPNTFSTKGNGDDQGMAARLQYTNTSMLNKARGLQLISNIDYEHVQEKFRPLERLRYVEFSREWGLPLTTLPVQENIFRFSTQMKNEKQHSATYQFMTYQRSDHYKGYQNIIQHTVNLGGWLFNNQYAITNFTNALEKGSFLRPVIDISKQLKKLALMRVGVRYALEKNEVNNKLTDSFSANSFSFDTYTAYLKSDELKKNKYSINFFTRADKYPYGKEMVKGDRSYNINLQAELLKSEKHQFLFNTTFRKLEVYNEIVAKQKQDRTILGRAEYLVRELNGFITGNVFYELGAGQEQKRDFTYIEVPAGQGEFAWIDYNNDNIQQLNEFEVAQFQDQGKFIRLFIPTNQFTKANYTTLNYSFTFNPKAVLKKDNIKALSKFAARFNWQTSMQKTKKAVAKGDFEFNPFKYGVTDTALLTLGTSLLNTISFNRYSSNWGIDFSNLQNTGKSLLTYGYESRKLNDWIAKLRWVISPSFTFNLVSKQGLNALYTPSFQNRNYELDINSIEPQLSFINRTVFRLQASYKWDKKNNEPKFGGEKSVSNSLNLETKYNVLQNASVNAKFTFNHIQYDANNRPQNSTVSYIMLDGLLPGQNFLWSLDFTKRLLNNVELNFQYEGRKPGETKTIHIGRAAVRALF
jgi:hypothetical protein